MVCLNSVYETLSTRRCLAERYISNIIIMNSLLHNYYGIYTACIIL